MAADGAPATIELQTPDGVALAGDLSVPRDVRAAAVLCHPHPLHGGNRHVPLIGTLFRTLPERGIACLRFDFRGAGRSGGAHDNGVSEQVDVATAVDHVTSLGLDVPIWLVGWSFGADVSLAVGHSAVAGWVGIAPPLEIVDPDQMAAGLDERPTTLLVPEYDQFNPPAAAIGATEEWTATRVSAVPDDDHFLARSLDAVADRTAGPILDE